MTTRRILLFALVTALIPASLGAQTSSEPAFRLGVFGGVSLARVSWTPAPAFEIEWSTQGTAGLSFERRLREHLFVETRLQWARKGAEARLQGSPLVTADLWIDYLSVPALVKVKGSGRLRPYLATGIEINTKLSAKARVVVDGQGVTEDMGDDAESTDVVIDVGGGLEIPVGSRNIFVEAMYGHGLRHVANLMPEQPGSEADRVRTRTLHFNAGIRF